MKLSFFLELEVVIHRFFFRFTLNAVNSQNIAHTPVINCKYKSCTEIEATQKSLDSLLCLIIHLLFPPIVITNRSKS